MGVEAAVRGLLADDAQISSLAGARIYPQAAPQKQAPPYITYFVVSNPRDHILDGPSSFNTARIQIDCWATDYATAKALADRAELLLDTYTGQTRGYQVMGIFMADGRDAYEPPVHANEAGVHKCSLDVMVWYGR